MTEATCTHDVTWQRWNGIGIGYAGCRGHCWRPASRTTGPGHWGGRPYLSQTIFSLVLRRVHTTTCVGVTASRSWTCGAFTLAQRHVAGARTHGNRERWLYVSASTNITHGWVRVR